SCPRYWCWELWIRRALCCWPPTGRSRRARPSHNARRRARAAMVRAGRRPSRRRKPSPMLVEQDKDFTLELLRDLTTADGVPGFEREVGRVMERYLAPLAVVSRDRLGSVIGRKRGNADSPRIMLAGHLDEVGFLVSMITDEGFLRFQTLGGWWD